MMPINKFKIKTFDQLNTRQLYNIIKLRMKVFCVEQQCPYQDVDDEDFKAIHVFLEDEGQVICYARILNPEHHICYIGRVVVDEQHRNKKLATKVMQECIDYCQVHHPLADILLSAQSYLTGFYQSLGFQSLNKFYLEDDIPHEKMKLIK